MPATMRPSPEPSSSSGFGRFLLLLFVFLIVVAGGMAGFTFLMVGDPNPLPLIEDLLRKYAG